MPHAACYQVFGRDFYIEPASAQFANAVFQDEYQINDLRSHNVRTIVDIGAHFGSFTVLCHHFWPNAKILAVEAEEQLEAIKSRIGQEVPLSNRYVRGQRAILVSVDGETATLQFPNGATLAKVPLRDLVDDSGYWRT